MFESKTHLFPAKLTLGIGLALLGVSPFVSAADGPRKGRTLPRPAATAPMPHVEPTASPTPAAPASHTDGDFRPSPADIVTEIA